MNAAGSRQSVDAGVAAFDTTRWSVVLAAQGETEAAGEALEKLCRAYWWPLYGFVRRNGYEPEEAQDLTQGFFALLRSKIALLFIRISMFDVRISRFSRFDENIRLIRYVRGLLSASPIYDFFIFRVTSRRNWDSTPVGRQMPRHDNAKL